MNASQYQAPAGVHAHVAAFLADVYSAGVAAGSWVIDGNTSEETARRLLQGIEDGDPAVMDELPEALWNGEWADEPTYEGLARDAGLSDDEADDTYGEALAAFSQGVEDEVVRSARATLGDEEQTSGHIEMVAASGLKIGDVFSTDGGRVDALQTLCDGRIAVAVIAHGIKKAALLAPDHPCPLWREGARS